MTEEDWDFAARISASLDGTASLPLEVNEHAWATFQLRHARGILVSTI